MKFGLDSSTEESADEDIALPSRAVKASSPLQGRHRATSLTPRKGILRNATPSSSSFHNKASVQRLAPTSSSLQSNPRVKEKTPKRDSRPLLINHSRNKSGSIPSFELVGVSYTQSSLDAAPPIELDPKSVPSWMRSNLFEPSPNPTVPARTYAYRDSSLDANQEQDESHVSELSDDTKSDDGASSSSSSSLQDDFTDSEEEEWPVDPNRFVKRRQRLSKAHNSSARKIKVASAQDEWEDWNRNSSEMAWERARSRFTPHQESEEPNRAMRPLQGRTFSKAHSSANTKATSQTRDSIDTLFAAELDEVRKLLSSLDVKRKDQEQKEREAFEARNRTLWKGIDESILAAENEARKAAAAEAERLAKARQAQEEAERKAREQREAELKRIEAEKTAKAEAEEKKKSEQTEKLKQEEEAKKQEEKQKAMGGTGNDIRRAAEQELQSWISKIQHVKENILPKISQNAELRKQCFAAKRQITPKVGQLTNSRQEIVRITNAIGSVLNSAKQASPTGEIYTWIINHLSKCLIRQAEQEVAAKQDTAFPLARVVVWLLLAGHKELGEVLMARLVKKCCWCLAVWPGKKQDQDEESYRKSLGYKSKEETNEMYTTRMSGIFAFYVAILQTQPTPPPSLPAGSLDLTMIPDYFRPKAIWIWSVRSLSPESPINAYPLTPSLWATLLEVGGNRALAIYGKQMGKVWRLLLDQGLRAKKARFVQKGEEEGYVKSSIVRLQLLLEGWEKSGTIVDATKGSEMEEP